MPLMPTQDINTNAVDMGGGPSVSRAGQVYGAIANAGDKLQDFSTELMAKRKQAEITSFVNTSSNDLERFVSDKETELKAKYTGDPTGLAQEMDNSVKSWYEERISTAPNDDAKSVWEQKFNNESTGIRTRASSWENKQKASYQVSLIDDSARKDSQHLALKPDTAKAASMLANNAEMVNSGVGLWYNEMEAKDKLVDHGSTISKALFEGMEANKQYGAGLALFDGKDPNSKIILANMKPEQIANYKDRFTKLAQAESEFSKSMFNLEAGDVSMALQDGRDIDDRTISNLAQKAQVLKPDERAVFMDNLNSDVQYNKVLRGMKTMPMDEIKALSGFAIPRDQKDIFNLRARTEKQERFQKVAADLIDKRVNKAPEYHFENDQSIRSLSAMAMNPDDLQSVNNYTKAIVSKQMVDGVSNPKILTPAMSQSYATMLKSGSPDMAEKAYQALAQGMKVGEKSFARNAISDMVANKHIEPVHGMALSLENPESRKSALLALSKSKEIDEQYKNMNKSALIKENSKEVLDDSAVNSFKNAIMNGTNNNENLNILNGFDSLIELEYKSERINGKSPREAKKNAIDKVLKNNFSVAKSGNSQIILGAEYVKKKDDIQNFMSDSLDYNVLKDTFKIKPDPSYAEKLGLVGQEGLASDRYYKDLASSGEWVTNNSQNGATLYKRLSNGGRAAVLDNSGNPISLSFDQMRGLPKKRNVVATRDGF